MKGDKYKIAIIGAGKVGTAVGNLLSTRGHDILVAVATTELSLGKAAPLLPNARLTLDSTGATAGADVVLITTKDEQIKAACDVLVAKGAISPAHTVIHMSGAGSLDILASARDAGAKIASIHPIQSFASAELAIDKIPGSFFGVTAEGPARDIALTIVDDLGGRAVDIADNDKTLYHAAACIASNYLVTLLHLAAKVYEAAGFDRDTAIEAMMPLVKGTVSNIETVGTVAALTGPIARGDVKIIGQHVESLQRLDADIIALYKALGLQTIDIATKKGTISEEAAAQLTELLNDEDDNA